MSDYCVSISGGLHMAQIQDREIEQLAQILTTVSGRTGTQSDRLTPEHMLLALQILHVRGKVTLRPFRNSGTGSDIGNRGRKSDDVLGSKGNLLSPWLPRRLRS